MAITPRIPHDDLVVTHTVNEDSDVDGLSRYFTTLSEPDGTTVAMIGFHKGSPEKAWHGWTTAKVIEALIAHMDYHQGTPFACEQNEEILGHLKAAHKATEKRRDERKGRGVLYDHKTP